MAGIRLDPDQGGALRADTVLHGRRVLERVGRDDAVVMIRRGDQYRGVLLTLLHIVNWRVRQLRLEFFRVVAEAIIRGPVPANGELLVTQHVHDAGLRNRNAEQVGTLVDDSPNQQSSIRGSIGGEMVW